MVKKKITGIALFLLLLLGVFLTICYLVNVQTALGCMAAIAFIEITAHC